MVFLKRTNKEEGETMLQISLKAARVNANLRQIDVADKMDVDVSTIIKWEKEKTAPRWDQFKKLCEIYNCSTDDIFLKTRYA